MSLTLVNCIEYKKQFPFEEEIVSLINSYDSSVFNEHFVVQPNNNNISEDTIQFINKNAKYIKKNLTNIQKDKTTNYTNVPIVLDYVIDIIKTDYTLFTDLDVLFFDLELPETDKCIITKLDLNEIESNNSDFNTIYIEHFKEYLSYNIDSLSKSINTWFIYAKTDHFFWKMYKKVTFELLEINNRLNLSYDMACEEIAASIIYEMYPNEFIDTSDFINVGFQEVGQIQADRYKFNASSIVYHYDSRIRFEDAVDFKSFNKKESKLFISKLIPLIPPTKLIQLRRKFEDSQK